MRIGEVSRQYHISVDNLYYYINYGLLVPPKPRGQYIFNKTVLQDLEWILELKDLDFTLREIHMLLSLKRISGLADSRDIEELKAVYEGKREFCLQEINRKQEIIQKLDKKIAALKENQSDKIPQTGVPVSALPLLYCPVCGSPLALKDVEMNSRFLYSGALSCSCGYQAQIQNGILLTPNKNTSLHDTPDITRELYKDLPPELITMFERSYQQMLKQMEETNLHGKVIAETYINAWFFMHNHLAALPKDSLYLVIDKYPETLLMYKHLIEKQRPDLNILYLADSSTRFPLKPECIDVHLDFFAANEHNFYHNSFLYERLLPYLKKDADLIGTYFYFEHAAKSMKLLLSQYPECSENNFNLRYFREELRKNGFELLYEEDCGCTTDSGNNLGFGFHVKGEKMHLLPYHGKRELSGR